MGIIEASLNDHKPIHIVPHHRSEGSGQLISHLNLDGMNRNPKEPSGDLCLFHSFSSDRPGP
jgi:hypothetical protein